MINEIGNFIYVVSHDKYVRMKEKDVGNLWEPNLRLSDEPSPNRRYRLVEKSFIITFLLYMNIKFEDVKIVGFVQEDGEIEVDHQSITNLFNIFGSDGVKISVWL